MGIKREGKVKAFSLLRLGAAVKRSTSSHYLKKLYYYLISVMLTHKMVSEKP